MSSGSILVTGANGGLGSAIVQHVLDSPDLAKEYHGLYTVRNPETATTVQTILSNKADVVGHTYDLVSLDLSSLESTRKAAREVNERVERGEIPRIRALILNAAWQEYTTHTITEDGFDMTFQVNHLGHFLFTLLVLKSLDKENGRVVVLGSWSHDTSDKRNTVPGILRAYEDEKWNLIFKEPVSAEPFARGRWSTPDDEPGSGNTGFRRYGASKLCEIMFMRELAKRLKTDPSLSAIGVLAVDPGAMPTNLTRRATSTVQRVAMAIANPLMSIVSKFSAPNGHYRTPAQSASDVIRAAFDTETLGKRPDGIYLNGHVLAECGPEARDERKCEVVWRESIGFAGIGEGDTVLKEWR